MGPLLRQNHTNYCTNAEVTRGGIVTGPPQGGPFSLQILVFSSLEGTKPCFSFGKRTLGPHGPPMGRLWWSKSLGNSHYFHKCMAQSHAFPLENVHLGYMAPPWGHSGGPNPSVILTIFTNAWHKAMLFLWKTYTCATWAPHGAILVVQIPR